MAGWKKSIRVLISGGGGDTGQGVIKALRSSELDIEIFAMCIRAESPGLFLADHGFVAPRSDSLHYLSFVESLISSNQIDVVIPTVDSEITLFAEQRDALESTTGAQVFVNGLKAASVTEDKLVTSQFLANEGLPFASTISADDPGAEEFASILGFPIVVKPRRGHGSQDVQVISDKDSLLPFLGNARFIFQEWLNPNAKEFTSGVYIGDDGAVKGVCLLERELRYGSTHIARRVTDEHMEMQIVEAAGRLEAKYLNVQAIRRGKTLIPFELNGRLSGSTAIISRVFNAPEMFIRERVLGERLNRVESNESFVAMRYLEELYVAPEKVNRLEHTDGLS